MNFTHIRRLLLGFVFIMATIAFAKYGPFEYLLMIPAAGVMYLAGFSLEMAWKGWREHATTTDTPDGR